jgi:gentisate 1,2-dioxygenase
MSHTLAPADVSHYYQRLAELSTLPFWQREEFTEPTGPERGHVWHWQDVYPELARSRHFEPVVWMDGLDVPFVLGLRAGFMRDDPYQDDPLPAQDATETAAGTAALLPAGTRHEQHNPVRRYPWDQAYPALRRLMARSPRRTTLTCLEYRNPLTGGPALTTLGCLLEGLPAGARTRPRRETASSVIVVARGTGTLICGGQTFALLPNDVAAIPA